jgi:hypothetical protein
MRLSPQDAEQFYRLHKALMFFVSRRLGLIDETVTTPEAYAHVPWEVRFKVHKALVEDMDLIDAFLDENPYHLDEGDLDIVRSWKDLVAGTFYVFRQLQNYMVFLSENEPVVAYGVLALSDPFEALVGPDLPRMVKTTLLPFKGMIVYDGLMSGYNVTFGPGIRRSLNESYKKAKAVRGIVTSLPPVPAEPQPAAPKAATRKRATRAGSTGGGSTTPAAARAAHDRIVALIDAFCRKHLDEEYASLCRKMAGILARKRPSPLTRGKPESWASGIVRAVGWVNFIDDPSQPKHLRLSDIDKLIGVSEATGSAKSMAIRNLLRMRRFDPEWTVPSRMDQNLLAWLVEVNGLPVDVRLLPREVQEQAFRKGLIPYVPGDRKGDPGEE